MTEIKYIIGDATSPVGEGFKIIPHCCNDIGGWGSGFVLALSKKWEEPERSYRQWFEDVQAEAADPKKARLPLGQVQFVPAEPNIEVANMIGQRGISRSKENPPIRYKAINQALNDVANRALGLGASIHAPRFGAGLAGGDWKQIEEMVYHQFCLRDIPVTIYDLA